MLSYHRTIGLPRRCVKAKLSYRDRVEIDNDNRVFFIYSLGRYRNTPLFYYGDAYDISTVEYALRKELPTYEKKIVVPVEDSVFGKQKFEAYIQENNLGARLPIQNTQFDTVFTLSDTVTFNEIEAFVKDEFGCRHEKD